MTGAATPVRLEGVSKGFGGRLILDSVDLVLHQGRITVVVGPSGGGKSVLLDLILGFTAPDCGRVVVGGEVGMVFQDSALFDDMSVAENLAFPARRLPQAEREQRVADAAAAVSLAAGHLAVRPSQLSGGLKKRAAIARALVQAAPVLLYDEPTAGLDAAASRRIGVAIKAARDAKQTQAILAVTHDYVLAAAIADEIHYLDPDAHKLVPLFTAGALDGLDRQVARNALEQHFAENDPPPSEPGTAKKPLRQALGEGLADVAQAALALGGVRWPSCRSLLQRTIDVGVTSIPAVLISGFVLGLVTAVQIGVALSTAFDDLDPLPSLLGVVLFHHVGPLYTGLFLAGRVGARVASEVGIKTYLRQADALSTLGTTPEQVWLSPLIVASLLSFPLLCLLLEAGGIGGGFVSYVMLLGQNTSGFVHTVLADVHVGPTLLGSSRAMVTGVVVVTLAYNCGRSARRGSDAVGRATTRAVVSGLLGAIAVELLFSLGEL